MDKCSCAVQEVAVALGAPDPCYPLFDIIRELAGDSGGAVTSTDNSIEVTTTPTGTDLSIDITSTDGSVIITPPTVANPGTWNLSVTSPGSTDIDSTATIDVEGDGSALTPYLLSLASGALAAGPGITVAQQPDDSFVISATAVTEPSPFSTDRIRYVSQQWSEMPPSTGYHFTTFADAYTSILAETPAPSAIAAYTIFVYPGFYTEVINAVSNVNLVGLGAGETRIALSWLAGQGVNAPNAGLAERINLKDLTVFVNPSTYVDSTAKTAGECSLTADNCIHNGSSVNLNGRGALDSFLSNDSYFNLNFFTVNDFPSTLNHCIFNITSLTISRAVLARLRLFTMTGGSMLPTNTVTINNSIVEFYEVRTDRPWSSNNSEVRVVNSTVYNAWTLALSQSSLAYIINTPYETGSITGGASNAADRSTTVITTPALVTGSNVIPIPLAYINPTYRVMITPVLATAVNTEPAVTARAAASLTLFTAADQPAGSYELVLTQPEAIFARI